MKHTHQIFARAIRHFKLRMSLRTSSSLQPRSQVKTMIKMVPPSFTSGSMFHLTFSTKRLSHLIWRMQGKEVPYKNCCSIVLPSTSNCRRRLVADRHQLWLVFLSTLKLITSRADVNAAMDVVPSLQSDQSSGSLQTSAFSASEREDSSKTTNGTMSPAQVTPVKSGAEDRSKRLTMTSEQNTPCRKKAKSDQSSPFKSDISSIEELFTPQGLEKEFQMTKAANQCNPTTDPKKKIAIVCKDMKKSLLQLILNELNI